jgi:hypothetical protein
LLLQSILQEKHSIIAAARSIFYKPTKQKGFTRRRLRFVNCSQKEAMDFKVASFLLLLLIVTCGAAQGQGNDFGTP